MKFRPLMNLVLTLSIVAASVPVMAVTDTPDSPKVGDALAKAGFATAALGTAAILRIYKATDGMHLAARNAILEKLAQTQQSRNYLNLSRDIRVFEEKLRLVLENPPPSTDEAARQVKQLTRQIIGAEAVRSAYAGQVLKEVARGTQYTDEVLRAMILEQEAALASANRHLQRGYARTNPYYAVVLAGVVVAFAGTSTQLAELPISAVYEALSPDDRKIVNGLIENELSQAGSSLDQLIED